MIPVQALSIGMTAWNGRGSEGDEYSGSEMTRYRGHRKPLSFCCRHRSASKQFHAYQERCPLAMPADKEKRAKKQDREGKEIEEPMVESFVLIQLPDNFLSRSKKLEFCRLRQRRRDRERKLRIKHSLFSQKRWSLVSLFRFRLLIRRRSPLLC